MKYYSTNKKISGVSLKEAVIAGLADDRGLFMPERIAKFDPHFFDHIDQLSFQEIAEAVASKFFSEDVEPKRLKKIVDETLNFDCPVVPVTDHIWSLELFHGPTLAFKDVGARFMARLLEYFTEGSKQIINVLVATSGDTGSAVANGFLNVPGIKVFVLYPKGKVSEIQEKQFATLGANITALEIDGNFDDCQCLVKQAFLDKDLRKALYLTSANSINVARFLPQAFYYFNAYARLKEKGILRNKDLVVAVPSGNFGNLTAGLFAREMGLPIEQFIAANNENDVVYRYLQSGRYEPHSSVETIANAMDVGSPSNFARILDLYNGSYAVISRMIKGCRFSDAEIRRTIKETYDTYNYLLDPHGACAFSGLNKYLKEDQIGVFLETAHPAKFLSTIEGVIGKDQVVVPEKLLTFMKGEKKSIALSSQFEQFKNFMLHGTN